MRSILRLLMQSIYVHCICSVLKLPFCTFIFFKADVDSLPALAERYRVMSMPTFLFLKNGEELERFSGASLPKLQETITRLI